ncbi:MAG: hypothetical protein Q8O95_00815 [bacterium]|nr:hypothetical protein [bacterium]
MDDIFDEDIPTGPVDQGGDAGEQDGGGFASAGGGGNYSSELVSKKIKGRQRTFFVDLKESSNGKFVKVSELSRGGQRSTIMFDGEDIDSFIEAFQEIKAAL